MIALYANVGRRDPDIQVTNTIEDVEVSAENWSIEKALASAVVSVISETPKLQGSVISITAGDLTITVKPKNTKDELYEQIS